MVPVYNTTLGRFSYGLVETFADSQNSNYLHDTNDCWKLPPDLENIDISHSVLLCDVTKVLCYSNNSLKVLNVAYQRDFTCIDGFLKTLQNLPKLENLDVSGNHLKTIPSKAFSILSNLKHLSLAHNALGWPIISFDLRSLVLQTLNFSDNSIGMLSSAFTDQLDKISDHSPLKVDLTKNELVCDCNTLSFVAWIRYSNMMYKKNYISCFNSDKLRVINDIDEIHEKLKYQCTKVEVVLGCVACFTLLTLILSIIALVWYKRWKFNYLLSIARYKVNPYHPIDDNEIEMEYDVYISYERDFNVNTTMSLHQFVTQKLYPELQRRGFRVFIRDELRPGIELYNGISDVLRKCDKVIALISKSYCTDQWNVFEFNRAVLEGIYTQRQVMIPVAVEEIGREHLREEIFTFLKSGPVPYLSANVTTARLFDFMFNKLRDNRGFGASQE